MASGFTLRVEGGEPTRLPLGRVTVGGGSAVDVALPGLDGAVLVLTVSASHVYCRHAHSDRRFELDGLATASARLERGDRVVVQGVEIVIEGEQVDAALEDTLELVRPRAQQSSLQSAYLDARASRETSRLQGMLDVVFRAAGLVAHVGDIDELARGLVTLVSEALSASAAWCLRFDGDGAVQQLASSAVVDDVRQPSRTVLARVFAQRVSLLTLDAERDPRLRGADSLVDTQARSIACAPIFDGERVIGVLYAELRGAHGVPQPRDLELLESIASFAGVALSRADLIAALEQREVQTHLLVHDMKNPLGAIRGALDLLALDEGAGETARRARDLIGGAYGRLEGYINDILAAAQLEEGQLSAQREVVDGQALREQLLARWSSSAQLVDVTLAAQLVAPLSRLRWDARLMERVMDNLIENALQHAPRGSAIIISIAADGDGDGAADGSVRVEVRDAGPGVPQAQRERVFEKFGRLTESAGRGLGLYFCRLAVEAHGGSIRIEGAPGDNRLVLILPNAVVEPS
ncbi:MAG: GAF domain-containing protein [Myxococcales bacterium]|nr:GAF domain-containing protein [Myxococcales bacterium]